MDGNEKIGGPGRIAGLPVVSMSRRRNMERGAGDLALWIRDMVALGLWRVPDHVEQVERMAERMVDAQLGSVGRTLRKAVEWIQTEADWLERWTLLMGELRVFLDLFARVDELPPLLAVDVWQYAGVFVKKKDVMAQTVVRDEWLVLGVNTEAEDRLLTRRCWLFGMQTRRLALLLDFGVNKAALGTVPPVGSYWQAALCFYPSAVAWRALVAHAGPWRQEQVGRLGFAGWEAFRQFRHRQVMQNPLLAQIPCLMRSIRPIFTKEESPVAMDSEGYFVGLETVATRDMWTSFSAMGPVGVFGEMRGQRFSAWSVITQNRLIACN